ncbi:MAG: type I glyceraldehyde-3-phosphate dehydrogenase [Bacteroidetes bacterium]|nr:type I glyceraldehyde-3-phosphate dehydrogenase [Bacteroidota bacterium]
MTKIAINGFGRIGRLSFRNLLGKEGVQVVAINDLTDAKTLAHLLKYDSIHGRFPMEVSLEGDELIVGDHRIKLLAERDPKNLPWKAMEVDLVLECTGIFRSPETMDYHRQAGAKKVLLSAPAQGAVKTVVLGVNDHELGADDVLASNASCTTNCLAPMAKVLHEQFGIVKGFMTTTHAYTADQRLQDSPHSDLRRSRAAALSIIPTTTGAAKAVGLVLPELKGKLDGFALRVPTPTGSVTDLTVELSRDVSVEEINSAIKAAADSSLKGILEYTEDPIVSADIVSSSYSCIFDSALTSVNGNMAKVVGWYDNEAGYSARLADMALKMAKL